MILQLSLIERFLLHYWESALLHRPPDYSRAGRPLRFAEFEWLGMAGTATATFVTAHPTSISTSNTRAFEEHGRPNMALVIALRPTKEIIQQWQLVIMGSNTLASMRGRARARSTPRRSAFVPKLSLRERPHRLPASSSTAGTTLYPLLCFTPKSYFWHLPLESSAFYEECLGRQLGWPSANLLTGRPMMPDGRLFHSPMDTGSKNNSSSSRVVPCIP